MRPLWRHILRIAGVLEGPVLVLPIGQQSQTGSSLQSLRLMAQLCRRLVTGRANGGLLLAPGGGMHTFNMCMEKAASLVLYNNICHVVSWRTYCTNVYHVVP